MTELTIQTWALVAQAVASFATVANLIFLFFQLRIMRGQLEATNTTVESQRVQLERQTRAAVRSSQGSNVFQLIAYLEEPRHLEARAICSGLGGKPFEDWSPEERRAADLTSRVWNQAVVVQKLGLLPEMFLHYYYGASIARHWRTIEPLVREMRANSDQSQRADFEKFAAEIDELKLFESGDRRPDDRFNYLNDS